MLSDWNQMVTLTILLLLLLYEVQGHSVIKMNDNRKRCFAQDQIFNI